MPPIFVACSRAAVERRHDRKQPARLRRILPPLRDPPNIAARIVRPHHKGSSQWQTTLRLPPRIILRVIWESRASQTP